YPHVLSLEWLDPYRAERIAELLEASHQHTRESFRTMLADVAALPWRDLARYVADVHLDDPKARQALNILRQWDGRLAPDSAGAAIYAVFREHLLRGVFGPRTGDALETFLGRGRHPLVSTSSYRYRATG